jgi:hypothetical protein
VESSHSFPGTPLFYARTRIYWAELGRSLRVTAFMVDALDDDESQSGASYERAGRYWKKAAGAYQQACHAESQEAKTLYMQVAMAWATLADEMERTPVPLRQVADHYVKH